MLNSLLSNATGTPTRQDVVVVGASAGGLEALADFAARLPAGLLAAVLVVLHLPAYGHSVLPAILNQHGPLPAQHPADGEPLRTGCIYVAPPDHHLLVREGRILLTRGPAENSPRRAIDTLFRTAARAYGPRVVGIVLSGMLDDGTAGLQAIKMRGGTALVQDPSEALFAGMPQNAIENVAVDGVWRVADLAEAVVRLAGEPANQDQLRVTPKREEDVAGAEMRLDARDNRDEGRPSVFSCPDCHCVLWEVTEGMLTRYRCRDGHAFSPDSLLAHQSENLEEALWVALRALEESAAMAERLQGRASERGHALSAQRFEDQAQNARHRARMIQGVLNGGQITAPSLSRLHENESEL